MYNHFCLSSYLTFRYVAKDGYSWKDGVTPSFPRLYGKEKIGVKSAQDLLKIIEKIILNDGQTGILLSSGIDSLILASFLPAGTKAYTIRFIAEGAIDESNEATVYAKKMNLDHKIIDITWQDYSEYDVLLMKSKCSPLHAIEVPLYKAALQAKKEGIEKLIIGNGADSTFGGMDKLLSKDWTYQEFQKRYTFVEPSDVLKKYIEVSDVYLPYKTNSGYDVPSFLKTVHGAGIIQTFNNAIETAGCSTIAPYESVFLDEQLDIKKIRNGETKYILREVFKSRFPEFTIPEKIPFARPMNQWLADWEGPTRSEFLDDIDMGKFTGDQKWIIYSLEKFMNLFEKLK